MHTAEKAIDTDDGHHGAEKTNTVRMEDDVDLQGDRDEDDARIEHAQRATWPSLFNFTRRSHAATLAIAILLSVISGIIIPAVSIFLGRIFNSFTEFGGGNLEGPELVSRVSRECIYLTALGAAGWILNGGYFMCWLVFGEMQARTVRHELFDGLMDKDMAWYDMRKNGISALIPRLQSQMRELQMATSQPLGFLVQYTVTAIAALGVAFFNSWNLTLVTLATVPLAAVLLSYISGKMQPSIEAQEEWLTRASKSANTAIKAIETVKCFNGEEQEISQFGTFITNAARYYLFQAHANALQIGLVRLFILGMFVQGFWYGSTLIRPGGRSAGEVLTTFWAALMATQAIEQILPQMIVLEKGRVAGATLKAMMVRMERGRKVTPMVGTWRPVRCDGDIDVRNVSFAYPARAGQLALHNASFFFPAGETTFVVGRSGSGKSTLGNLLMRHYSTWSGDISIDGRAIQTLDLRWIRDHVTLVQQQSVLFNETLIRNIALGRTNHQAVSREEVRTACGMACLQQTINDLPQGLDTMVQSGGSSMSGGQRQRVALARARLRDTPILILDESTSALDHIGRSLVMDAIREWRHGKTTIIITHDISQIYSDDYVYVLDKGRITQEGFRGVLEKADRGLFSTFLPKADSRQEEVEYEATTACDTSPTEPEAAYLSPKEAARESFVSQDSMDIQIAERPQRIPSVYVKKAEGTIDRSSFHVMSPLNESPPQLWSTAEETELVELTGRTTRINRQRASAHRRSLSNPLSTDNSSKPLNPNSTSEESSSSTRPKKQDLSSLHRILSTVWPTLGWSARVILILGFLAALLHAAATPVFSYVFAKLLATFFSPSATSRRSDALKWSLCVLAVAVGDATASYFMHFLLEFSGQRWVDTLRVEALGRILRQPRGWFDKDNNSLSRLSECLDRNAEEMRNLVGRFAGFVFVALAMTTIAIIWSLSISWKLTLVGLATAPFMYAITRSFEFVSGRWEGRSNDAAEVANGIFGETFGNIGTVRALTLETYFGDKYGVAVEGVFRVGSRRAGWSGVFFGGGEAGILFITALIFYYGSLLAASLSIPTTDILTVFTMLIFSIANANSIISFIPQINSSRDTAHRLLRLSKLPLDTHESRGRRRLSTPLPIIFNNCSFAYPSQPGHPILRELSLMIPPNSFTAIVGSSGSGKSTLASLIMGLYPPASPSFWSTNSPLTFGPSSTSITALDITSLRTQVCLVPQTPLIFPTTIRKNIGYGLSPSSLSLDEIIHAARLAGAHEFIISLPDGYDTYIGEGGVGHLSGGQAQRIVVARALVRKPKVLVLDEATSSLDGESAGIIRRTLRRLIQESRGQSRTSSRGVTLPTRKESWPLQNIHRPNQPHRSHPSASLRTSHPSSLHTHSLAILAITHDQAMMQAADHIVVMEHGRVVEQGGWEELMRRRGGGLRRLLGMERGGVERIGG
ncbi:MAG: hypothetical protein M1817_000134 [Caeruleum heppii]|nr:MAG: hypothetical protein M1817_000134 [Caeruleum heppii]